MAQQKTVKVSIYFSEIFNVAASTLEEHGAFDISLINDLPLFVDPFLLFNSEREDYQSLHTSMIDYVRFLRDRCVANEINDDLLWSWCTFPEVKQNWLGFSLRGNIGRGLGWEFAVALRKSLQSKFRDFGNVAVKESEHLERLCLIKDGIGRDNISDFTVNLIKNYLCQFTQDFAAKHLHPSARRKCAIEKCLFNYKTESWMTKTYDLPYFRGDYVLLTPKDILTKDESWINRPDLVRTAQDIGEALPNKTLRAQVARYFEQNLSSEMKKEEVRKVRSEAIERFPEIIDQYIVERELSGNEASGISREKVRFAFELFVQQIKRLAGLLGSESEFYETGYATLNEARKRVEFLKEVIENGDGYRIFYVDGVPLGRENDLQILFRLTWYASVLDVNREVNNGRGPVDFAVSMGSEDKSLVEMKLARNTKLKQNLISQLEIYKKANSTDQGLTVIVYFSAKEKRRVDKILKEIGREKDRDIYLIDADRSNKPSASNA